MTAMLGVGENCTQEPVILLGHGGTFRCMLPLILDKVDFGWTLAHGIGAAEYVLAETRGDRLVWVRWGEQEL